MARSKEFDRDNVLHRALDAFRADGYEGTSIQILVDRMGIHRASLYDTYGSKEQLFRETLALYERLVQDTYGPIFAAPGRAWVALNRAFDRAVSELTDPLLGQRSCLMLRTAVSGARHLKEVPEQVRRHFDWFGEQFRALAARASTEGDLPADCDPSEVAAFLRHVLLGIIAAAAVDTEGAGLRRIVERQLGSLLPERVS